MTRSAMHRPDPALDLLLERVVAVPVDRMWAAWTRPELIKQWFCPLPWRTVDCEVDLRPGGLFRTVMRGPDGQQFDNSGCYLEIVENEKLVWTGALGPGFRPLAASAPAAPFVMTAVIGLEDLGGGSTRYTALVLHGDEEGRAVHEAMGFRDGWARALDQLVAMIEAG